jgi:hypothetical protein
VCQKVFETLARSVLLAITFQGRNHACQNHNISSRRLCETQIMPTWSATAGGSGAKLIPTVRGATGNLNQPRQGATTEAGDQRKPASKFGLSLSTERRAIPTRSSHNTRGRRETTAGVTTQEKKDDKLGLITLFFRDMKRTRGSIYQIVEVNGQETKHHAKL